MASFQLKKLLENKINTHPPPLRHSSSMDQLIICPLCQDRFKEPKMLPCQHSFCQECIKLEIDFKDLKTIVNCPICFAECGPFVECHSIEQVLDSMPINAMAVSLMQAIKQQELVLPKSPTKATNFIYEGRCVKCQMASTQTIIWNCIHCQQYFCSICWPAHVSELKNQLGSLLEQLDAARITLANREEDFKERSENIKKRIESAIEMQISQLKEREKSLEEEADVLERKGIGLARELQKKLKDIEKGIHQAKETGFEQIADDQQKVELYVELHRQTAAHLEEVSRWGSARPTLDVYSLKIDLHELEPSTSIKESNIQNSTNNKSQLEEDAHPDEISLYYRGRKFTRKAQLIRGGQRPAGLACSPWEPNQVYVAFTDIHQVLLYESLRPGAKVIQKIKFPQLRFPHGIACSQKRDEIYITDKWRHCIHVVSRKSCQLLRSLGTKGTDLGRFRSPEGLACSDSDPEYSNTVLYVCDSGNDRVQVIGALDGKSIRLIGRYKKKQSEFNQPSDIALSDDHVVVADFGNHRIKVFTFIGVKLFEFGTSGSARGMFRSPECIAVDMHGFIFVGDSGNQRIQIFRPNGNLVREIKNDQIFGWLSGITLTAQRELLVSDYKYHCVHVL